MKAKLEDNQSEASSSAVGSAFSKSTSHTLAGSDPKAASETGVQLLSGSSSNGHLTETSTSSLTGAEQAAMNAPLLDLPLLPSNAASQTPSWPHSSLENTVLANVLRQASKSSSDQNSVYENRYAQMASFGRPLSLTPTWTSSLASAAARRSSEKPLALDRLAQPSTARPQIPGDLPKKELAMQERAIARPTIYLSASSFAASLHPSTFTSLQIALELGQLGSLSAASMLNARETGSKNDDLFKGAEKARSSSIFQPEKEMEKRRELPVVFDKNKPFLLVEERFSEPSSSDGKDTGILSQSAETDKKRAEEASIRYSAQLRAQVSEEREQRAREMAAQNSAVKVSSEVALELTQQEETRKREQTARRLREDTYKKADHSPYKEPASKFPFRPNQDPTATRFSHDFIHST